MKLGKKPAVYDKRDVMYGVYRSTINVTVPRTFGRAWMVPEPQWGMLGNDQYGDCVWAGAAHETMVYSREGDAGQIAPFTDEGVLSDYASTGFDPATGANDNGTDPRQAANYRRSTGIVDANGKRHKIGAYVALEPGNWAELLEAMFVFTAVGVGIEFPDYAMTQFNDGVAWSYRAGGTIEGGHYIPALGHPAVGYVRIVTWAKTQLMTRKFYETYCDEAYAYLSPEALKGGYLRKYDLGDLQEILQQL